MTVVLLVQDIKTWLKDTFFFRKYNNIEQKKWCQWCSDVIKFWKLVCDVAASSATGSPLWTFFFFKRKKWWRDNLRCSGKIRWDYCMRSEFNAMKSNSRRAEKEENTTWCCAMEKTFKIWWSSERSSWSCHFKFHYTSFLSLPWNWKEINNMRTESTGLTDNKLVF